MSGALLIPSGFDRWPLTYRARTIAAQLDARITPWRRIRETLLELADEVDLAAGATPQVWPPKEGA